MVRGATKRGAKKGRANPDRLPAQEGPVAPLKSIEQPEEEPTPEPSDDLATSPAVMSSPFSGRTESEKWALKHWKKSWEGHLEAASPPADSDGEQSPHWGARQEKSPRRDRGCPPWGASLGAGRALLETELRVRDAAEAIEKPTGKPGMTDGETRVVPTAEWLPRWLVSIGNNIVSAPCCACQSRVGG